MNDEQNIDPEELMMRANVHEFGKRIAMIVALEEGGKITVDEAYDRIKSIWKKLKKSKKNLIHEQQNGPVDDYLDQDFPFSDPDDDSTAN